jgi:hypothetical protein
MAGELLGDYKVLVRILKGHYHFEDPGISGRIILK